MKGLHPEYLLGKKGSHLEQVINSLALIGSHNDEIKNKLTKEDRNALLREMKFFEQGEKTKFFQGSRDRESGSEGMKIKNAVEIKEANLKGRFSVYSVGKNFFETVSSIKREVPFEFIGGVGDILYIKAPDISVNGVIYNGCYVRCMDHGLMLMITPRDFYTIQGCRILLTFSVGEQMSFKDSEYFEFEHLEFDEHDDGTQIFADFTTKDSDAISAWMNGIVNSAVYINSQDPDIEKLRPLRLYDKKSLSTLERSKKDNLCTLPLSLVNWAYHGRRYSVDSTTVVGHFRIQPCGAGRSEKKVVWIDEHERRYDSVIPTGIRKEIDEKSLS